MPLSVSFAEGRGERAQRLRRTILAAFAVFAALFVANVAGRAIVETFAQDDFPEQLAVKVEQLPILFPIHMLAGALALVLIPLAIAVRRWPRWHRPIAYVTAADVLIAGLTAFPVAWTSPVTAWSAAGFSAQAIVWMSLLALGIWHIRNGRRGAHRRAMMMMAATASGAVFFRIYLALWAILSHRHGFELFYACDAWLAWLGPLAVTAYGLRRGWRILL
jgi:uncharacterized membrane protein YozB (DUF420 family)